MEPRSRGFGRSYNPGPNPHALSKRKNLNPYPKSSKSQKYMHPQSCFISNSSNYFKILFLNYCDRNFCEKTIWVSWDNFLKYFFFGFEICFYFLIKHIPFGTFEIPGVTGRHTNFGGPPCELTHLWHTRSFSLLFINYLKRLTDTDWRLENVSNEWIICTLLLIKSAPGHGSAIKKKCSKEI